jgi:hypothetical protein
VFPGGWSWTTLGQEMLNAVDEHGAFVEMVGAGKVGQWPPALDEEQASA